MIVGTTLQGFPEVSPETGAPPPPTEPADFFGATMRAALAAGVITPEVLAEQVSAELLAQCLPRSVWARVLTTMLGASRATMGTVVEAIGAGALLDYLPPQLVWQALAEAGRRALAPAPVVEPAPVEDLSFEALILPLRDEAVNHARKLCRDPHLAEDIAHDALTRAFRAWPNWVAPDGVVPQSAARRWLFTIVTRTFISSWHRTRDGQAIVAEHTEQVIESTCAGEARPAPTRRTDRGARIPEAGLVAKPAAVDEEAAASADVQRAIARLSPGRRAVIERFYFRGMTCEQIAAELGIPDATARTRLVRARARLKTLLATFAKREYGLGEGLVVDAGVEPSAEAAEVEEAETDRIKRVVG